VSNRKLPPVILISRAFPALSLSQQIRGVSEHSSNAFASQLLVDPRAQQGIGW
jgi:hypothetical protein